MNFRKDNLVICIKRDPNDYWQKYLRIGKIYKVVQIDYSHRESVRISLDLDYIVPLWYENGLFMITNPSKLEKLIYGL